MHTSSSPSQFVYAFAKDKGLVVLPEEAELTLAVRQGADPMALVEARRALGAPFLLQPMDAQTFDRCLAETFASGPMGDDDIEAAVASRGGLESLIDDIPEVADLLGGEDDAPVIRLINGLIHEAVKRKASDVHIDPFENRLSIRYRIDGDLSEVLAPPRKLAAPLVSRIKVMARLDIAEKKLPQDGRISLSVAGRSIDVRVATLPTRYGERVVLRLLDTQSVLLDLSTLGMDAKTLERYSELLSRPNGVILVTGPVGSGKTTTLYSSLSKLNTGHGNIMTLEDPVEYGLAGVSQTQMDDKVGLTFAATLRSVLRHDPDIAMIGEIRDGETAEVAFKFASMGRLAFSTLHTNSAAGAITRLRDMGVEAYLMASTLRAVMAQRLVRKLCVHCKTETEMTDADASALGVNRAETPNVFEPVGCMACNMTGFDGRIGIYELLVVDAELKRLINAGAAESDIERAAFEDQDQLIDNAMRYIRSGETSVAEVLRVCRKEVRDGSI
jgi:general secretion pathway protein E